MIKLIWPRPCAGCSYTIKAGSYAYEEIEAQGVVFHGVVCAALYACKMLVGRIRAALDEQLQTKPPPT